MDYLLGRAQQVLMEQQVPREIQAQLAQVLPEQTVQQELLEQTVPKVLWEQLAHLE
jgi:hypothetical protein